MTAADFRAWRLAAGWTQPEAAAQLGLSTRSIVNYESGTYPIPRAIALACKALIQEQKP